MPRHLLAWYAQVRQMPCSPQRMASLHPLLAGLSLEHPLLLANFTLLAGLTTAPRASQPQLGPPGLHSSATTNISSCRPCRTQGRIPGVWHASPSMYATLLQACGGCVGLGCMLVSFMPKPAS